MMTLFAIVWSVAVFCGPNPGEGMYMTDGSPFNEAEPYIVVQNEVCRDLRAPRSLHLFTAFSVFVLAHEQGHANDPILNRWRHGVPVDSPDLAWIASCGAAGLCENYADCFAAGHMYEMARTLGFSGYNARRIRNLAHRDRFGIGYKPIPQRCWS
jgi:hypothetical protein